MHPSLLVPFVKKITFIIIDPHCLVSELQPYQTTGLGEEQLT
jgi:hypothetical protein